MADPADPAAPGAIPAPDGPGPADPGAIPAPDGPGPVPGSPAPGNRAEPRPAGARLTLRVAVFVVAAAACGLLAWAGAWFVPFLAGLAAGALSARGWRWVVLPAAAGAVVGWAFPLWVLALRGQPVGATARSRRWPASPRTPASPSSWSSCSRRSRPYAAPG